MRDVRALRSIRANARPRARTAMKNRCTPVSLSERDGKKFHSIPHISPHVTRLPPIATTTHGTRRIGCHSRHPSGLAAILMTTLSGDCVRLREHQLEHPSLRGRTRHASSLTSPSSPSSPRVLQWAAQAVPVVPSAKRRATSEWPKDRFASEVPGSALPLRPEEPPL